MDSRAFNRDAIIAVEMPVPAITGLPNPTSGFISIHFGSLGLVSRTDRKNPEHSLEIDPDSFQVHAIEVPAPLSLLRHMDQLPQLFDEEVGAFDEKRLTHEGMLLGILLCYFCERAPNLRKLKIINFAHAGKYMAFQQIQEREAHGAGLCGQNHGRQLLEPVNQ
jgi:hypothetical protein